MATRLARPMPTEASDLAGPVHKVPFLPKQNLEPAVIYKRCRYVSNTKPVRFYMYFNALMCNSLIKQELEEPKRDGTAAAQLIAQLSLIEGKERERNRIGK